MVRAVSHINVIINKKIIYPKEKVKKICFLDHNKMILGLEAAHASIFNKPCQGFFLIKSACEAFFCVIRKFLSANIFGNFLFLIYQYKF